jgi:HdeA/HdeB family protein
MLAHQGVALGIAILASVICEDAASAQPADMRNIGQYTCKDIMREHGDNRDVAIAFLHGFLLGTSGSSTFNLDSLHKRTTDFIEYCLDHPGEYAIKAMSKIQD